MQKPTNEKGHLMKTFSTLPLSVKTIIATLLGLLVPFLASYGYVLTSADIELISAGIVTVGVTVYSILKTRKVIKAKNEDKPD